jgi:hypothetical protein
MSCNREGTKSKGSRHYPRPEPYLFGMGRTPKQDNTACLVELCSAIDKSPAACSNDVRMRRAPGRPQPALRSRQRLPAAQPRPRSSKCLAATIELSQTGANQREGLAHFILGKLDGRFVSSSLTVRGLVQG